MQLVRGVGGHGDGVAGGGGAEGARNRRVGGLEDRAVAQVRLPDERKRLVGSARRHCPVHEPSIAVGIAVHGGHVLIPEDDVFQVEGRHYREFGKGVFQL